MDVLSRALGDVPTINCFYHKVFVYSSLY